MRWNEIDLKDWKNANINVDSLWIIPQRDKSGKHQNIYHGNFIPQIPRELFTRYTKRGKIVLDAFLGSGTSLYEAQNLGRKCIGMDINSKILEYVKAQMEGECPSTYYFGFCDNTDSLSVDCFMQEALESLNDKSVQFVILHPPYMDIVHFSENPNDLSHLDNLTHFVQAFVRSTQNVIKFLDVGRYFAVVIGDVYKQSDSM
ncbi:DNA methyltransferase [Helicobacter sp. MIT 05-5293]|uniref:TRM11 family SAM-dependent methyltransferase n=1 Tax=Helicobacter sp. MIT 05-5293 TaxID=1548149 RepID=UPI000B2CE38E|nr:DNA methyltransferase [Helicobacter sp. MIT 05-5293]